MTKQELFTKVTGLTFDVEKISADKLGWYIPDGAMLDNSDSRKLQDTQEFMEEAGLPVEGKVSQKTESTAGNEDPKVKPSGKGWKKVVDVEAVDAVAEHWILGNETFFEDPTFEVTNSVEFVSDEASWNASFANGVLKAYYEKYPSEDLWHNTENRGASYNDRHYEGTLDGEAVEADIRWASDKSQKLIIGSAEYYAAIFYDFTLRELPLFNDAALTESADKVFVMTAGYYVNCSPSYAGWIANGAKAPWVCVNFINSDPAAKIIVKYEGYDDARPWGDSLFGNGKGHKAWGIESLQKAFDADATNTNKVQVVLEHVGVEHVPAVEAVEEQYHWERTIVE